MSLIKILEENVSNAIAAGEVVENASSMIKELLENSLDAKSKNIKIEVKKGGLEVVITDDGTGMNKEDLILSTERHATSKIRTKDDLFKITTYGFRGEALSSISSISKMKITSRTKDMDVANIIYLIGGKITNIKEIAAPVGTKIEISELFFNTPARLKFLRKESTEYANIKDIVLKEALANYETKISLIIDDKENIKTTGNGLKNTILELFGKNLLKNLKKFDYGYVGNTETYRASKDFIFCFVNKRPVKSTLMEKAVIDAFYTKLMKGKFPFSIIFLDVNPSDIDINVHPSKKVVKFANQSEIYTNIKSSIEFSLIDSENFVSAHIKNNFIENDNDFMYTNNSDKYYQNEVNEDNSYSKFNIENFKTLKSDNIKLIDINIEENKKYDKINNIFNEDIQYNNKVIEKQEENFSNFDKLSDFNKKEEFLYFNEDDIFKLENPNSIPNFKLIGQVFDTFILVERNGILEIYDQHIIHERILYEKLKLAYKNKKLTNQSLLVPIRIELNPKEKNYILDNLNLFQNFGFEIDDYEKNEILLRAVPTFNFRDSYENTIKYIIDNISSEKKVDVLENILISMSCKGAIKANHKLKYDEMERMVAKLHEVGEYTCPHGRPIITKITLNDLEKLFKRK